jgi:hypothetical protein
MRDATPKPIECDLTAAVRSLRFPLRRARSAIRSRLSLRALRGSGRSADWVDESATGSANSWSGAGAPPGSWRTSTRARRFRPMRAGASERGDTGPRGRDPLRTSGRTIRRSRVQIPPATRNEKKGPGNEASVAKTAVVAKAITPGPSPVAKTAVVAAAVTPGRTGRRRRI